MKRNGLLVIALAVIVTVLPPSFAGSAEKLGTLGTLGRLFFTTDRRATLERQRQYSVQEAETLQGESVSLGGIVKRSNGRSTVWVNGRAHHDNGVTAKIDSHDPAKATIANGDELPLSLRVGESSNRATGEKTNGLGGGTIVIKRGAAGP